MNINIDEWHKEYQRILVDEVGMSKKEANLHLQKAADFDYGYSPGWYLVEEGLL
ncbi:MAG: hypothetical protein GY928_15395 [Colwellia sp.]|nr:hypothetical protein [Colwellia sp.]